MTDYRYGRDPTVTPDRVAKALEVVEAARRTGFRHHPRCPLEVWEGTARHHRAVDVPRCTCGVAEAEAALAAFDAAQPTGESDRPKPPPFRPNRDLIGYIEEGRHPPRF
jgi:hypothetical protein